MLYIAEENLGVGTERSHAFLDTCAAGIVHPDDRTAGLERHVQHLANLETVHLAQRTTVDGEVLSEREDFSPVDAIP